MSEHRNHSILKYYMESTQLTTSSAVATACVKWPFILFTTVKMGISTLTLKEGTKFQ